MSDPFPKPKTEEGPWMSSEDNWVSFGFTSDTGYDKIMGTVHGSPEFVADKFGIKDFDGKISTLMKQAVKVDAYFKSEYAKSQDSRPKA